MSTQGENKDTEAPEQQGTRNGTTGSAGGAGTDDIGATNGRAANRGNQQSAQQSNQQGTLPPSETDADQYDQGTVQRAP